MSPDRRRSRVVKRRWVDLLRLELVWGEAGRRCIEREE
jgi:hypothetical protein